MMITKKGRFYCFHGILDLRADDDTAGYIVIILDLSERMSRDTMIKVPKQLNDRLIIDMRR
jgi:hypothetical protein